jgi:hypothetical protein
MRESYKRFVKTWIVLRIHGLFCESMDLYRIVTTNPDFKKVCFLPYKTNPGFISWITNPDFKRFVSNC